MLNYISVNLSKLFTSLIGFITQYFLIRIFISSEIGIITYLLSISTIIYYLSDLGLTNHSRRILPSLSINIKDYYSYVQVVLFRKFLILVSLFIIFLSANFIYSFFNEFESIIIIITTFNLAFNTRFIFESRGNFIFYSIFEAIIKILSSLLIILFTYLHWANYFSYFIILNLIQLIISIILIFYFFSKVTKTDFNKIFNFRDFTKSLPYLIPSLYFLVFGSIDRVLLIAITNSEALFIHSQAIFITSHLITFSTSLSSVNSPESTKVYFEGNIKRFNELIKSTIQSINFISFPVIIGFNILMIDFSPLFFNSFSNQIKITSSILIWDILFNGFFYLQMEQILMGMRKISHFNKILIISTLWLIPLYLILIPLIGYYGAALSIVIGRIIAVLTANIFIIKLKLPKFKYIIPKYFFLSIIMGATIFFVRFFFTNTFNSIIVQILTGVILYTLLIILFDRNNINLFIKKIKSLFIRS